MEIMFLKILPVYLFMWAHFQFSCASPECPLDCQCSRKSDDDTGKRIVCRNSDTPITGVDVFDNLSWPEEVVHIDVSGNEITTLKKDAFKKFTNLEKLNLSNSELMLIEPGAFQGLHSLQKLDLSGNRISVLNSSILAGLQNVERLFLGGNRIKTIEEGTFSPLTKLKRLDLGLDQVRCDCHVSWIVGWLQNSSVRLSPNSTCDGPTEVRGKPIKDVTGKDLHCDQPPDLDYYRISPSTSQIMFQGDRLPFECEASVQDGDLTLVWVRNGLKVKDNATEGVQLYRPPSPNKSVVRSKLLLDRLAVSDSGAWQCVVVTSHGNKTLTVNIIVVPQDAIFCPQVVTHTNRGTFVWKNTFGSTTPHQNCQAKHPLSASHHCNSAGQWEDLDVSKCPYTSEVTRTLQQCAQIQGNMSDADVCTTRLRRYITDSRNITDKDDVIFIAQILEGLVDHMTNDNSVKLSEVVINLASLVVDVTPSILYAAQDEARACSRIVKVLEKMPLKQLTIKSTVTYTAGNIAYHALQVQQGSFGGITCRSSRSEESKGYGEWGFVCDNNQPSTLTNLDEKFEALIHIPAEIFQSVRCLLNECDHTEPSIIQVIVYRKAALFPHILQGSSHRIDTAVISARINTPIVNTSHPVVIQLQSREKGLNPKAVYWDFNANGAFGGWVSFGCSIQDQLKNYSEIHCRHLTNFALIQERIPPADHLESWLTSTFNMSAMVYAGSSVLVICLLATIVSYILCRSSLHMPRKLKHCVPNLCLCCLCLCVTYTIGVRSPHHPLFCKVMGISIHYFSLCVLKWTAITAYIMYKKLQKARLPPEPPDPDAPAKPVLGLYLLGWGLALLLCGIVAAINSLQHYSNPKYCFLLAGARIYAFYVPVGCVVVVIGAFFLCICCTIHGHSSPPHLKPHPEHPHPHPLGEVVDMDPTGHYDEGDTLTNIDSISPPTNMDSVIPAVYRNPSQMSGLTTLSASSSLLDVQYRPITHLKGMLGLLLLYLLTWTCGALAVALPFEFIHQEIVFNCLYLLFSTALGVFILVYFVFGRRDGRTSWRRACCCDKSSRDYDLNQSGSTNLRSSSLNGHLVQSASSIEGSQYTNKSSSNTNRSGSMYRYGPMGQLDRSDVSVLHSNVPTVTESSAMPDYPNFFNEKQNGIAKKYWQKTRQKQRIAQLNKELKSNAGVRHKDANSRVSFDDSSDQNTHISLEIQLEPQAFNHKGQHLASLEQAQNFYNSLTRQQGQYGVAIDGPGELNLLRGGGGGGPPLAPYGRYQIAPMVGMSSPPSSTLLPPDGGSCISTEISSHVIPPAPMTSPQSSAISCMPPSSHSLPRPAKHQPHRANPIPQYMQRNGSVPRLRDFDGKSSTSRDTRPLSIGSDTQTLDSYKQGGDTRDTAGQHLHNTQLQNGQLFYSQQQGGNIDSRLLYSSNSNRNNNGKEVVAAYSAFGNGLLQTGNVTNNIQSMCIDEEPNMNDLAGGGGSYRMSAKPPIIPPKSRMTSNNSNGGNTDHKRRKSRELNSHNPKHHKRKGSGGQFVVEPCINNAHSSNIAKVVRTNSSSMDEQPVDMVVTSDTGLLDNEGGTATHLNSSGSVQYSESLPEDNQGESGEGEANAHSQETEGLLQEQRLNILNGNLTDADVWLPHHNNTHIKPKNMETCV